MANKHMNKCLTSLTNREMESKTTMKYHYTPLESLMLCKYNQHG